MGALGRIAKVIASTATTTTTTIMNSSKSQIKWTPNTGQS
jgi:hypothetical protein